MDSLFSKLPKHLKRVLFILGVLCERSLVRCDAFNVKNCGEVYFENFRIDLLDGNEDGKIDDVKNKFFAKNLTRISAEVSFDAKNERE